MRKYLAALTLLVLPAALLAQGNRGERGGRGFGAGGPGMNPVEMILEHRSELNLTADQVGKLESVAKKLDEQNQPIIAELQKLRGNGRSEELTEQQREQVRAAMEKVRDNREDAQKAVAEILTAQQEEQLHSFMPKPGERGGMAGGRGGRGGPGAFGGAQRNPIESILEHRTELALTSEQVSKLEAIASKLKEQDAPIMESMRQFRQDGTRGGDLTDKQREEMRDAMEKMRDNREDALKSAHDVLTKDQQQKLESLRPERRGGKR